MNNGKEKKIMGRYTVLNLLGKGSMGEVYKARDPYIDRYVAIKLSSHHESGTDSIPDKYSRKFFHEARTAGRLTHPNICAVYDANISQGTCYFVMEYIDGTIIKDFCSKDSLLPLERVVEIIYSACKALDYAHNMNVVHRDIKPSNILLDSNNVVKITDFGIALITEGTIKLSIVGTPHYMSPEQIEEQVVDGRSDIFSLGCVLYEMLTGGKIFPGSNPAQIIYKITKKEPVSLSGIDSTIPQPLVKIIGKALSKDPDERYQTCSDFAYELKVVLRQLKDMQKETEIENVLDYVCNIPFFNNFSREQVEGIMTASMVLRFKQTETIVSEGEVDDSLFIILSGKVDVLKRHKKIDSIEKGECFGEMAYLSGHPRDASIIASTDCVLLKVSATLMDKAPESVQLCLMRSFSQTLVHRLSKNNTRVWSLLNRVSKSGQE